MADAADTGKLYSICITAELPERNFFDVLEKKFASPLGGIQQAGARETCCEKRNSLFYIRLVITRGQIRLHFIITGFHTEIKTQVNVSNGMNTPAFALHAIFDYSWTIGKTYCFD